MKILVISQYFYPEQFRINDIVKELVKRKHKVTVLTGLPNYPEGEIYTGYEQAYKYINEYNGAKVYRCKLRPRYKGIKNLALNYLSFVVGAIKLLRKIKPNFDIIYVYEPSPVTVALPAIWYKNKYGIPIYYYCMDLWPESILGNGINNRSLIYFIAKEISKYVYKNVDIIGNKCEEFNEYISSVCGINKDKMKVLYEHAENSYLSINERPIDNGIIDFMFLGNIGVAQNCDIFVDAFARINYKNKVKLHFVGDGSCIMELKQKVKQLDMESNVIFHGKYPIEEIDKFYELADVCLLSLRSDNACGMTPPGKLFSYLASARPIVAMIGDPSKSIIEKSKCGYVVSSGDVDGLARIMQDTIKDSTKLYKLGINGRKYFLENYTLEQHIAKLENQLLDLINKK